MTIATSDKKRWVLVLSKCGEHYVFAFDPVHRVTIQRQLGRFAVNPDLSFTWYDAWAVTRMIRERSQ